MPNMMEEKTPNYTVDTNAPEFQAITSNRDAALDDLEQTYSGMINQSDAFYQKQIDAAEQWGATQSALQQERTDFTIEQIEQQKAQAKKDYTKEQSGAYVDWQKQSNEYGANAEAMAAQGMAGSGYSESSQVSMYNTYQNRVAMARDSFDRAILNYNNSITEARIANNAALAEIAYNTLQKTLELSLQGFQYKNQLVSDLADKKTETSKYWQTVWNDLLDQKNTENALNEDARQADIEHKEWKAEQAVRERAQTLAENQFAWQKEQAAKTATINKSSGGGGRRRVGSQKNTNGYGGKALLNKPSNKVNAVNKDDAGTGQLKGAIDYINSLIASGASKDKVANEIAIALREGAITKAQANELRTAFTPRGVQY